MSELDEKLNQLLSDPGSMAQVMKLAQELSGTLGGGGQADSPSHSPPKPSNQPSPSPPPGGPDALGGLDPKLLGRILPLLQAYGQTNSNTQQLLTALRPFLREEKQEKIQRAAQLARLIHLAKKFLTEWGAEGV